jgi:hypothetical protein
MCDPSVRGPAPLTIVVGPRSIPERKCMNFAIKKGWTPGVVAAVVAIVVFMPADAVTEILTFVQILVLAGVALLVLSRVVPVAAWPAPRQSLLSWSVAVGAAVIVCLEPLLLSTLRRRMPGPTRRLHWRAGVLLCLHFWPAGIGVSQNY